jgi:Spy/CpxP family protein refolding chaperone
LPHSTARIATGQEARFLHIFSAPIFEMRVNGGEALMQNRILSISSIALLTTVSAGLLTAQTTTGTTPTRPTPAQMTAREVARLTTLLTLTTEQQTQATAIFTTEQTAMSSLFPSLQAAHKALQAAVKTQDTTAIATLSAQIGTLTTRETQARSTAQAAFYAILSNDQQTKYEQLPQGGFGGHGRPGAPGGPGPGGPQP